MHRSHVALNLCLLLWIFSSIFVCDYYRNTSVFTFWLLINQTSNIIFCTVNNTSYLRIKIPAGFSYHTALRFNRSPWKKNPSHRAWNHVGSIVSCQKLPASLGALRVFTVSLRMEDDHRGGRGRVEGFVQQQQLFGGREGGRECWQVFQCNVGWQSGVQCQHGRYDAVGQQAFWLST